MLPPVMPSAGLLQMADPATKTLRELYVGNLPPGIVDWQLKEFMSQAIMQGELATMPGSSLLQVRVNGKFAFAEFRSVEECNLAQNLSGILCMGTLLDVKRPAKYNGQPMPSVTWPQWLSQKKPELLASGKAIGVPEGGMGAGGVSDPNTKVLRELYIGNTPPGMGEAQLQQIFNEQMKLRNLILNPGLACLQVRISAGFSFAEFRSVEETNLALAHLNGLEIQGSQLRIGRPRKYEETVPRETQELHMRQAMEMRVAPKKRQEPTAVIQLSNMLTAADLANEEEFADIVEDVQGELGQFGEVISIEVPKEGVGATHIYVHYKEVAQARMARMALQGRMFDGRKVNGWFYPRDKFDAKEWVNMLEEFGPAEELQLDVPVSLPSKTHRACKMVGGKWVDISPTGTYGNESDRERVRHP